MAYLGTSKGPPRDRSSSPSHPLIHTSACLGAACFSSYSRVERLGYLVVVVLCWFDLVWFFETVSYSQGWPQTLCFQGYS